VKTLIANPATASHCDLSPELRVRLGIPDRLIRVSVGLESPVDLIADFEQAFAVGSKADTVHRVQWNGLALIAQCQPALPPLY